MRLRADARRLGDRALRLVAYGALAVALVLAWQARTPVPRGARVAPAALPALLADLPHGADSVLLVADTALDPMHRDWLRAHRAAGRAVRWSGATIPAMAMAVEPTGDPAGADRVLVVAPAARRIRLADSAGLLDSATSLSGGAVFAVPSLVDDARASSGAQQARAVRHDSLLPRRVVVLGRPGWEAKFVLAALEERGWTTDARFPLSPDTATVHGSPARFDTAVVAAVVVLDATASRAATQLERFVRQGGGVVLGPAASLEPGFAALRAGEPGAPIVPALLDVRARDPRRALPLLPISELAPGAVAIEHRDGLVAVAARRVGAGRVIQVGYDDTWRWRMTGPEGALEAHRRWWSALVASAAYRATLSRRAPVTGQDAPLARLVAALGPPDPSLSVLSARAGVGRDGPWWWLCVLTMAALVAEWSSRRRRGLA